MVAHSVVLTDIVWVGWKDAFEAVLTADQLDFDAVVPMVGEKAFLKADKTVISPKVVQWAV